VTETPTVAQMTPQTRHYIERGRILANFKEHFTDGNEFMKLYGLHCVLIHWQRVLRYCLTAIIESKFFFDLTSAQGKYLKDSHFLQVYDKNGFTAAN